MTNHVNLSEAELHEPKGMQSLVAGEPDVGKVVVSKGDGTSETRRLSYSDLAENVAIVYVSNESDLPTPVGGVIPLGSGITYVFTEAFTISARMSYGENTQIDGLNSGTTTLSYLGVNPLFSNVSTGASLRCDRFEVNAPNAPLFDLTDGTDAGSLRFESCNLIAGSFGNLTNADIIQFNQSRLDLASNGISFLGTSNPVFNFINTSATIGGGTFLDLGSVAFRGGRMEFASVVETGLPSIGINALGAANVLSGSFFDITECLFLVSTPLSGGVRPQSSRWTFFKAGGIQDSQSSATTYLDVVRTVPVAVTDTFYPIAGGNWQFEDFSDDYVVDANGLITYVGEQDAVVQIQATTTLEKVGGGADFIAVRISKNGTTIPYSEGATDNSTPSQVTSIALLNLTQNDTIQMQVANRDSTSDIIVDLAALFIVRVP